MTDLEFDILDELYFVQPYDYLASCLSLDEQEIYRGLKMLIDKGWIKCFRSMTEEIDLDKLDFDNKFKEYFYLASKTGLMAHNST